MKLILPQINQVWYNHGVKIIVKKINNGCVIFNSSHICKYLFYKKLLNNAISIRKS